jgi:hypothetical protein
MRGVTVDFATVDFAACAQAFGRLPWLAFFFARARRLRAFFAIVGSLSSAVVSCRQL